ncbi:hypothetical protein D3C75_965710 [compost metagenome]
MLARPLHGQRGGGRQADQAGDARAHRLVDQLQAAAAGDHHEALGRRDGRAGQRTDQLVQRVVPTDVLAAQADSAVVVDEQRGMHRTAVAGQGLRAGDALAQAGEMFGRWQRTARQGFE